MEESVIFFLSGDRGESSASSADLFLGFDPSDDSTRKFGEGLVERAAD